MSSVPPWWVTSQAQVAGLWTTPGLALAGALLIAVPIIIHLLFRIRRKRMEWGAMRFLLEAFKKQRRRLQVERWLLLVVRCLVVLLLGLALAGPMLGGAGGWLGGLVGGGAGGRVVHVVLDDGLSSGMEEIGNQRRLEGLKAQAMGLVEALDEADRVVVWRAGVPVEKLAGESVGSEEGLVGLTPREAVAAIEGLMPRYGGSGVDEALVRVSEALEAERVAPGRAVVAVFSDFARGAGYLGEAVPTELEGLGRRANLALSRAAGASSNVQVAGVSPRRRLVVVEPGLSATVAATAVLRRFGGVAEPLSVRLRVSLRAVDGAGGDGGAGVERASALAEVERVVRLAAGQTELVENVDLVLPDGEVVFEAQDEGGGEGGEGGRWLAMVAEVEALSDTGGGAGSGAVGLDGLRVDDAAYGAVELRQRLRVGVVEDVSVSVGEAGLRAGQWLEAALAPGLGVDGFEVSVLAPAGLSEEAMSRLDVLMVARPDLLSSPAWEGVGRYAGDGGLVWVWMPSAGAEGVDWGFLAVMRQQLGLGMSFGGETSAEVEGGRRLDEGALAPRALSLVAAVWGDLVRPVRVSRWLPLSVGEGGGEVWLRLAGTPDEEGLLVLEPKGDEGGAVLVCGLALSPGWSNLVTRPILVPLLQDGVRGVLGGSGGGGLSSPSASVGAGSVVSGEQVGLDRGVYGTGARVERKAASAAHGSADDRVSVEPTDSAAGLVAALVEPGVYGAGDGSGVDGLMGSDRGMLFPVNVAAGAGDTGAADVEQLGAWLGALGPSLTVDAESPAGVLSAGLAPRDFGWELLWVLLGLVLLEMVLARRFSHASSSEGASVARRVLGHLRGTDVTHGGLGGGRRGRAA
ncbi:MAG: BatA domain-containing protein [Planctomycetota bacterium]